jgi:hypothetical protein
MNPSSDFDCEIFQRVLANAFAVQERRDFTAAHSAPETSLPQPLEEITDPEEDFVPEFMMLPQNRHSLYARWGAVIVGVKELPGFRHVAHLTTIFARRGRTVAPNDEEQDFASAPVATTLPPKPKLLNRRRSRALVWGGHFCPPQLAAKSKAADKSVRPTLGRWQNWLSLKASRTFDLPSIASGFVQRTKSLGLPNWRPHFTPSIVVSGFAQRKQNLNWSTLRRSSVPAAMIAIVLNFTFLMAHKPSHPATTVGLSALPGSNAKAANANTVEHRSSSSSSPSIPKPLPGKPAPTETASASPKSIASPTKTAKTVRRERAGQNEVEYIGDDVTVRTFTKRSTKPSREPNGRTAHIGDDVTVRYFASSPARIAAR